MKYSLEAPTIPWEKFRVWGLVTHLPGYSLASMIHHSCGIAFQRTAEDHAMIVKGQPHVYYFPCYQTLEENESGPMASFIHAKGELPLLPELKQFDFFLVVYAMEIFNISQINQLKEIKEIQYTTSIPLSSVKNRENLPVYH